MCFLHLLHFVLQVAPELQGGGKRKNPAPPLLWEQRSTSWYAGTVGKTVQGLMRKVEWSELIMGCPHAIHLAGLGSSTEDTKKLVLQLFQGRSPQSGSSSEWLNEWVSECTQPQWYLPCSNLHTGSGYSCRIKGTVHMFRSDLHCCLASSASWKLWLSIIVVKVLI